MSSGRPRGATWAALALLTAGAAGAAQAVTELAQIHHLDAGRQTVGVKLGDEMARFLTSDLRSNATYAAAIGIVAVLSWVLVWPLLRGRGWARRVAFVAAPILFLLQAMLMAGDSGSVRTGTIVPDGIAGGHHQAVEYTRELMAGWYAPLHFIFEAIIMAALVAAVVLLLRRETVDYFRRELEAEDDRLWSVSSLRRGST